MTVPSTTYVALVDDDVGLCIALERLLRAAGFVARTFGSAEEFDQQARLPAVRCLILDVGLPGMGGLELLRQLRAGGLRVPVVCITGQPDPDGHLAKQALDAGALALLHKPFESEALLRLLRSNLDKGLPDTEQGAGVARGIRRS